MTEAKKLPDVIRPEDLLKEFTDVCEGKILTELYSTGFSSLDGNIRFAKGYLAIVSGYPSSGKSEWVDAVTVNLSSKYGFSTMFYSPENHPTQLHMTKIAEKIIGKKAVNFTKEERKIAVDHLQSFFSWIYPDVPTLQVLMSLAWHEKQESDLDILVIDPWNAITQARGGQMIHEYMQTALTSLINFARDTGILVIVVAHPTKPQKDKDGRFPMPTLYDISDGAMWRNKADFGIICHREDMTKNEMIVSIQKIKQKQFGRVGLQTLDYDLDSGRFKCQYDTEYTIAGNVLPPFVSETLPTF